MTDIGPGDLVECVETIDEGRYPHLAPWLHGAAIHAGGIYTVERCVVAAAVDGDYTGPALVLMQPATHWRGESGEPGAWDIDWFRPVRRPSADFIESLKQPAPAAVRELIAAD